MQKYFPHACSLNTTVICYAASVVVFDGVEVSMPDKKTGRRPENIPIFSDVYFGKKNCYFVYDLIQMCINFPSLNNLYFS